jgi:trehalose 6-phosphate phosphatase
VTSPPPLTDDSTLFLDVDGTLLEIASTPQAVSVPPQLLGILEKLQTRLHGAVALVSGRSIASIDALFTPLKLPASGLHGLERRLASGEVQIAGGDPAALAAAREPAAAFARTAPGVVLEDKGLTLAIHYRQAPQQERAVKDLAHRLVDRFADRLQIQNGKMVVELRPHGADKGTAIEKFMTEPPFTGRVPVFVGDDATDEPAFAAVNRLRGVSVHVGGIGSTAARYSLPTVGDVRRWLQQL